MKNFIISIFFFGISFLSWGQGEFITVWDMSKPGAVSTEIMFNADIASGGALYSWQVLPNGTAQIGLLSQGSGVKTISGIPAGSTIRLAIQPNNLNRFFMSFAVDRERLIDVEQWGIAEWTSMENAFQGCTGLNISASDIPDLSNVNSMNRMFDYCTILNSPSNINLWNTSNVTQMWRTFSNANQFNQPIGNWNVQNVENMAQMFNSASAFNQPIGNWNTANVTNMEGMFGAAISFNQPIGSWDTGSVTNMAQMFLSCISFNESIENWNVSNVLNMEAMFYNAPSFNQSLNGWDVSSVTDMSYMFYTATSFNQTLSNWNTSSVTQMRFMFSGATNFNGNVDNWNVSSVVNMTHMFENASAFNQNLGSWEFFAGVELNGMLDNSGMDCNNYSATLLGWQINNPSIMSLNLGANNLQYGILGTQARDILMNNQGWGISGDFEITNNAYVVQENETLNGQLACAGEFTSINDQNARLVLIDPNGNMMDFNQIEVVATNAFITPNNPEIIPMPSGANGYYEINDGTNTFRVGRRMFKIEVPGSYTVNGGVKVRFYYDQNDFNGMVNDAPPSGGNIANCGWFKSATSDFQSTVDQMNASSPQMPLALSMIPVYGNENGVEYVELMVENFSVFGMYAQTIDAPLPVSLTSFNVNCDGQNAQISWTTASEFNAAHYVVQSSRDGFTWQDLGEIEATGTTNQTSNYNFNAQNYGGLTYFRLVQVDLDGATEIFGPISTNCELENNNMAVYPNPTTDNFTVRIETTESFENATLELIDMTGRVILSQTTDINTGGTLLNFNGAELKMGTYFVRIKGENDKFAPVRVVRM
jgi:surface protein